MSPPLLTAQEVFQGFPSTVQAIQVPAHCFRFRLWYLGTITAMQQLIYRGQHPVPSLLVQEMLRFLVRFANQSPPPMRKAFPRQDLWLEHNDLFDDVSTEIVLGPAGMRMFLAAKDVIDIAVILSQEDKADSAEEAPAPPSSAVQPPRKQEWHCGTRGTKDVRETRLRCLCCDKLRMYVDRQSDLCPACFLTKFDVTHPPPPVHEPASDRPVRQLQTTRLLHPKTTEKITTKSAETMPQFASNPRSLSRRSRTTKHVRHIQRPNPLICATILRLHPCSCLRALLQTFIWPLK